MLLPILFTTFLAFVTSTLAQSSSDLPTVSSVGSKFFFENGTQYYIKGKYTKNLFPFRIAEAFILFHPPLTFPGYLCVNASLIR